MSLHQINAKHMGGNIIFLKLVSCFALSRIYLSFSKGVFPIIMFCCTVFFPSNCNNCSWHTGLSLCVPSTLKSCLVGDSCVKYFVYIWLWLHLLFFFLRGGDDLRNAYSSYLRMCIYNFLCSKLWKILLEILFSKWFCVCGFWR